jgi:hypothetical protein
VASRFWVGGSGTWDASDTTHWSATSGGAGGQSVPGSADTVTIDGHASGLNGGIITVSAPINVTSITAGAANGTINFGANDVTAVTVVFAGTGTRNINMGSGTWTITATAASPICFDVLTITNLTLTSSSANIVLSANSAARATNFGTSFSYASLTVAANSTKGYTVINYATGVTFGSVTVASGNTLGFAQGTPATITGALTMTGTSSAPVGLMSTVPNQNVTTLNVGSTSTIDWGSVLRVTKGGAGSLTATNSLDLGGNTSITITAPSGGGGGQRVISG